MDGWEIKKYIEPSNKETENIIPFMGVLFLWACRHVNVDVCVDVLISCVCLCMCFRVCVGCHYVWAVKLGCGSDVFRTCINSAASTAKIWTCPSYLQHFLPRPKKKTTSLNVEKKKKYKNIQRWTKWQFKKINNNKQKRELVLVIHKPQLFQHQLR